MVLCSQPLGLNEVTEMVTCALHTIHTTLSLPHLPSLSLFLYHPSPLLSIPHPLSQIYRHSAIQSIFY